jgi:diadenosine tetraphosphate (Ap4A) HIT family hydrolase
VPSTCRWCHLVESRQHLLSETAALVVAGPGAPRCAGYVTVVPRQHVSVLGQLPLPEMAAVLAGVSKVSESLRQETGAAGVEIRAHPRRSGGSGSHLHFHLVPGPAWAAAQPSANRPEPVFSSLVEARSH